MTSRGVVAACAGEHGHLAAGFVDENLDDPDALRERQRRVLARRAAGHEEVNAGVDLPAAQPADRLLVEIAGCA